MFATSPRYPSTFCPDCGGAPHAHGARPTTPRPLASSAAPPRLVAPRTAAPAPVVRPTRREPTKAEVLAWGARELRRREAAREKRELLAWGERQLAARAVARLDALEAAQRRQRLEADMVDILGADRVAEARALEARALPARHVDLGPTIAYARTKATGAVARGQHEDRDRTGRLLRSSPELAYDHPGSRRDALRDGGVR